MDAGVGVIVNALKEQDMFKNSLILFTTDNGGAVEKFSNLPLKGAKESLYQGGIRGVAWASGGLIKKRAKTGKNDE